MPIVAHRLNSMNRPDPSSDNRRILVAEDQDDARDTMRDLLQMSLGLPVDAVADGAAALAKLQERPYSVLVTDLRMPKLPGMKLLEAIVEQKIPVTVIITTGHGGVTDAVRAMQLGAYDFLIKPADPEHLCLLVGRALQERELRDEVIALRQQLGDHRAFHDVLSKSPKMHEIFARAGTCRSRSWCSRAGSGSAWPPPC